MNQVPREQIQRRCLEAHGLILAEQKARRDDVKTVPLDGRLRRGASGSRNRPRVRPFGMSDPEHGRDIGRVHVEIEDPDRTVGAKSFRDAERDGGFTDAAFAGANGEDPSERGASRRGPSGPRSLTRSARRP